MADKCFSSILKHSNTDEWYTPVEPVKMIVPFLQRKGYKKILCPFDKPESNFVKVLTESGFDVTYSHIETGVDFFSIKDMQNYDAVVSNPPFSKREKILWKLFREGVPFAMIMNFNGLFDSWKRWQMFRENDFELIVPSGRVHYFNDTCDGNAPQFQSVFVCSGICDRQIEFADMDSFKADDQIPGQMKMDIS